MNLNYQFSRRVLYITCCTIFILCSTFSTYAQNTKKVRGIEGKCEITRHITLEQAEKKALENAKEVALRKAGVSENVWSIAGLISGQVGNEFSQVFSKLSTSQIDGVITILEEPRYEIRNIDGVTYAIAIIDAEVKKGISIDPTFMINIDGIEKVYEDGDVMNFTLKVYGHDAYVKLFWFDESGGSMVFPNDYEQKNFMSKETEYSFPMSNLIKYRMRRSDPSKEIEQIYVFAIATKENIPYLKDKVTFETMLQWLYDIDADKRASFGAFTIIR